MSDFKTIGGAGGIFHIFVPGLFLFVNLAGGVYLFPYSTEDTRSHIHEVFSNQVSGLTVTIMFSYLLGVVLRMLRCKVADSWSARMLRFCDPCARKPKSPENLYAYEDFPYTGWIGQRCKLLPAGVQRFYERVWSSQNSTTSFSFCKMIVISEDERSAHEIYAAEAICRYISSMFYALIAASAALAFVLATDLVFAHTVNGLILVLLVAYTAAILGILRNFRFMRIKDVLTLFAAAYKNRHLFEDDNIKGDGLEGEAGTQVVKK